MLSVIFPAAGLSARYGRNKLLEPLGGSTVLARSVGAFARRDDVDALVIVTSDEVLARTTLAEFAGDARLRFIDGGATRAESVRAGLAACGLAPKHDVAPAHLVAVHDAARPLVSQNLIDRTLAAARQHGAAVPALPVHLTIKRAVGPLPARVIETVPRAELFAMQTPQIMRATDLARAFAACPLPLAQVTDDAQLLELIGLPVTLVEGEERNLKITTQTDLILAARWLESSL